MKKFWQKSIIVAAISVLALSAIFLCGCHNTEINYNDTLYDLVLDYLNDEYLSAHSTHGIYHIAYLENDTRPDEYIELIDNEEDFILAFNSFPDEIDFDKEMLILYFFSGDIIVNTSTGERIFSYSIANLTYAENKIEIFFAKKQLVEGPTGSPLSQECLVVKLKKTNIKTIDVKLIYQ